MQEDNSKSFQITTPPKPPKPFKFLVAIVIDIIFLGILYLIVLSQAWGSTWPQWTSILLEVLLWIGGLLLVGFVITFIVDFLRYVFKK